MNETKDIERRISLVVADDHPLVLEGLRSLLEGNEYLRSVTFVRSAAELREMIYLQRHDAYMVNLDMADAEGASLVVKLRAAHPDAAIIVETIREDAWLLQQLEENGVDAVLHRTTDPKNILLAIASVWRGEKYYSPEFLRRDLRRHPRVEVPSPREMEVLKAMAHGYSTVEISHLLFISENTVETHRKNLMLKMGARNATDLVLRAIERGFLTLPLDPGCK